MSIERLASLAHYVCWKCDDPAKLGATKLNKVLWLADVLSFRLTGHPITGAEYVKRQFGPVPKHILVARRRLAEQGKLVERVDNVAGLAGIHFLALSQPVMTDFLPNQLQLVDAIIAEVCHNHTATSISQLSHDTIWAAAKMGETIPYFAWLGSAPAELTEDDFAWADESIARIEGIGDAA